MIKKYDLDIFRHKFWVGINVSFEEASSLLLFDNGDEGYIELSPKTWNNWHNNNNAITIRAISKKDRYLGYFVFIVKDFLKGSELVDCIAHESNHISDFLQQDIGCTVTDTEINSHISGYIAGKIMLTWNMEKGENNNGYE